MLRRIKIAIWRKLESIYRVLQQRVHASYVDQIKSQYDVHPSVRIGEGSLIYGAGRISIGQGTYMGRDCYIQCDPAGCSIRIGKCCAIAHNVHIRTTNYARTPNFADTFHEPVGESEEIVIGDYVWIGVHVYISAGVKIGSNSIIGANSVVTRDVSPNSVVGGVPARLIHDKSAYTPGLQSAPVQNQSE